ncbi:MAG: site-specific DNA-methyltransferase, partial [Prevotellaceae bacterium]|nr:site-specific DNA-methyltransferase [Prevotellaceae bacterium]
EWSANGNPRKIIYADEREGMRVQDIWEFKDPQYPDYPTEKNAEMLDLIERTSSNEGSIVLDCFCGSGTTLKAAQLNNRQWIGIDQSDLAIQVTKSKIDNIQGDIFVQKADYEFLTM